MQNIFDFNLIKTLFSRSDFRYSLYSMIQVNIYLSFICSFFSAFSTFHFDFWSIKFDMEKNKTIWNLVEFLFGIHLLDSWFPR